MEASGRSTRLTRGVVGVVVAAVISLSAGVATGLAQYGEQPPPTGTSGVSGVSGTGGERLTLLKKCIAKAQTKYGDNRPKRKKAIRKCRKKYG